MRTHVSPRRPVWHGHGRFPYAPGMSSPASVEREVPPATATRATLWWRALGALFHLVVAAPVSGLVIVVTASDVLGLALRSEVIVPLATGVTTLLQWPVLLMALRVGWGPLHRSATTKRLVRWLGHGLRAGSAVVAVVLAALGGAIVIGLTLHVAFTIR